MLYIGTAVGGNIFQGRIYVLKGENNVRSFNTVDLICFKIRIVESLVAIEA